MRILVGVEAREAATGGHLVDEAGGGEESEISIDGGERETRGFGADLEKDGFRRRVIVALGQRPIDEATLTGRGQARQGASGLEAAVGSSLGFRGAALTRCE